MSVVSAHCPSDPYKSIMEECKIAASIRVKCEPGCVAFKKALDACATRVEALKDKHPEANCELQYFDYQACVDKCVRKMTHKRHSPRRKSPRSQNEH